ncbi:Alpha/Beta hydrolase protein [Mycena alexandri]|uniref:Alpha/Beta hydrolase protein n=1 Tax=Mycena alexandri TaxID=1745969 RepID=A0AAD6SUN9_9AGAR|nr:Alpha/Beta hydrolase protein [Mycena alexandri]
MSATVSKLCSSSDGTLIYAEASGNPTNPSVVFAHGFALSGIVFDKLFSDPRMLDKFYLDTVRCARPWAEWKALLRQQNMHLLCMPPISPGSRKSSLLDKPVFVGWSAGAAIASDICSHISPVPISGVVAMSGPLAVNTAAKTLKPKLRQLISGFLSSDAGTSLNTRIEFVDALFTNPGEVSFSVKAAWIGSTVLQSREIIAARLAGHKSEQTKLAELGAEGFPAMMLYGTEDQFQDGSIGAAEARPYFTNLEVVAIEGGSHTVFYDSFEETVSHLLRFCLRISGQRAGPKY